MNVGVFEGVGARSEYPLKSFVRGLVVSGVEVHPARWTAAVAAFAYGKEHA